MTVASNEGSDAPRVVVLDVSDPPGGRSWLAVAEAVGTLRRLRATGAPVPGYVVVGALPVEETTALTAAAALWAAGLQRTVAERVDPWHGEQVVEPLLAAARAAVLGTADGAEADTTYRAQERAATTAVLAAVRALCPAPVVHTEEVLAAGGSGPWMRWARRELAGRPGQPRPTSRASVVASSGGIADVAEPAGCALELARSEPPGGVAIGPATSTTTQVPVVIPPRPHRIREVVERQQRAAWDGTVKWGNTWTLELTRRLHDYLKLDDDYQVLTTVSGTAALRMAYQVAAPAARPGDVVVVPSFTFAATGESLRQLGFRLRLVDVDPLTWTMDPRRLREALADGKPRMVVVVDSLGVPAAHDVIAEVAREHGVPVVADSAPSLGSLYRGRPLGMQQAAHAFSMSFAKTVTAGGAGGALVLPAGASVGGGPNWWRSSAMGEMHAVFALDQLDRVEELVARRQQVADVYDEVVSHHGVRRQQVTAGDRHSWVHYVVRLSSASERDRVSGALAKYGVQTKPYYAPVLHDPEWADTFGVDDGSDAVENLPVTQALAETTLALPMSSELRTCEVEQVATALDLVLRERA